MAFERLRKFVSAIRVAGTIGAGLVARRRPGGRQSVDTNFFVLTGLAQLAPFSAEEEWRNAKLDTKALDKVPPSKLIELLADVSPDVSRALWDFLLFMNPGFTYNCYKPNTTTTDKQAQDAIKLFLKNLHGPFVMNKTIPVDVIFASLFMGAFMRGAFFAELVLDEAGTMPLEIATPDPATIRAQGVRDPVRGLVWEIGQWQLGTWVPLDRETVFYIPIHPLPGRPYGRSLAAPAVFSTLFLIGLLHDMRRVIAQQGYPRLDIAIDFDKLKSAMPKEAETDPKKLQGWVTEVTDQVANFYSVLEPDDAFVHGNAITLNKPVGTLDVGSIGKLDDLISCIERMAVRALKTMPLLFGINESTSETHANRQWEIHVAGIKALQHLAETMIEGICQIALQVQGIIADVEFRFSELRAAELLRDAQVEALSTNNAIAQYLAGWITNDEASIRITGHKAVGPPIQLSTVSASPMNPQGVQAEPGSMKSMQFVDGGVDQFVPLSSAFRQARIPRFAFCQQCEKVYVDDVRQMGSIECPNCPGVAIRRGIDPQNLTKPNGHWVHTEQ